jgi:hypothetical protein
MFGKKKVCDEKAADDEKHVNAKGQVLYNGLNMRKGFGRHGSRDKSGLAKVHLPPEKDVKQHYAVSRYEPEKIKVLKINSLVVNIAHDKYSLFH